jgi:predicted permease
LFLFFVTLRALAPLFLLIVLGYGLKRARLLHVSHVSVLNGLVLNVTLPALIIMGLVTAPTLPRQALVLPLALLAAEAACMALAFGLCKIGKLPRSLTGAIMMVGVFGNTGFLGYPITLALHPGSLPEAILMDQFGMTIPMYLAAPLWGAHFGSSSRAEDDMRATLLRFCRSPLFLAVLTGVALRVIPWPMALLHETGFRQIGQILAQCLTYLGQGTTPVVLLALGVALKPEMVRNYLNPLLLASSLKLLVCPLAMWSICRALGLHGPLLAQSVLSSAMPTSVMASVLSAKHDLEGNFAVSAVCVSTLLAAVTIPLLLAILH